MHLLRRFLELLQSSRAALWSAILAFVLALVFLGVGLRPRHYDLRLSAGDLTGRRADLARALADAAAGRDVSVTLVAAPGSEAALAMVERGELDCALVQGGLEPGSHVREVTALGLEPLHLFVRGGIAYRDLADLRGLRIDLSPPGSGTRRISMALLAHAGLTPDRDFVDEHRSYAELRELQPDAMPDAIFHVSSMPSPIADFLVHRRGYQLVALPYAEAIRLRNGAIYAGLVPAGAYGAAPLVPATDTPTLATRMLLVARSDVPDDAVERLLEAADGDAFVSVARIRRSERAELLEQPELPLHHGAVTWMRRDDPWMSPDMVEMLENARSFLVSLVVALVLLWRWYRTRRLHGLDEFLAQVSRIDRELLELEKRAMLDMGKLLEIRSRIGEVKGRALEAFTAGSIHSEELLSSFLTHVSDVRSHLNAMILHERARLEKTARASAAGGGDEQRVLDELWSEALAEEHADREPLRTRALPADRDVPVDPKKAVVLVQARAPEASTTSERDDDEAATS